MPRITARQHRRNVSAELAAIKESHRLINQRLDGLAKQITGLATAARVAAVLDQMAALGTLIGEGQDDLLAKLADLAEHQPDLTGVTAQLNLLTNVAGNIQAAVKAAAKPAPAEAPAPAPERPAPAAPARRRRAANPK